MKKTVKVFIMKCQECGYEFEAVVHPRFDCPQCKGRCEVTGEYEE